MIKPSSAEPLYAPEDRCYDDAEDVAVVVAAAAEIRRSLLELNPVPPDAFFACLDVADELFKRGGSSEAARCWRMCLELDPANADVAERLAVALRLLSRPREAAEVLHGALAQNGFAGDAVVALLNEKNKNKGTAAFGGDDDDDDLAQAGGLYLDLGEAIDALAPAPGTGAAWPLVSDRCGEACAPFPVVKVGSGDCAEVLSAPTCFERAAALGDRAAAGDGDGSSGAAYVAGLARKRLAQATVARRGAAAARGAFLAAAASRPDDICCATHVFYGAPTETALPSPPPPPPSQAAETAPPSLASLQVDGFGGGARGGNATGEEDDAVVTAGWAVAAAAVFEREGAVVLSDFLAPAEVAALLDAVAARVTGVLAEGDRELTALTRAPRGRTHGALPLEGPAATTLARVVRRLWPLLAAVLRADEARTSDEPDGDKRGGVVSGDRAHAVLLGSGFMTVGQGSGTQELHNDVHGVDRHSLCTATDSSGGSDAAPPPGGPRVVSLQLQLTDTRPNKRQAGRGGDKAAEDKDDDDEEESGCVGGSLELLPGSHRPDAHQGSPAAIERAGADDSGVVAIEVGAGTATLYSSRLWHSGGANFKAREERRFIFLTLGERGAPAPPGLIHTMARHDVGAWVADRGGLRRRDSRRDGGPPGFTDLEERGPASPAT